MSSISTEAVLLSESLENRIRNVLDNLPYSNDELKISAFIDSLQDFAAYIYLSSHNKDLKKISDSIIQQVCLVIFNSNTKLYEAFLTSHEDADISEDYNCKLLKFFNAVQDLIKKEDDIYENIPGKIAGAMFMKRIMWEILNKNRSNLVPLKVLALLCAISGLDIPLLMATDSCCNHIFKVNQKDSINIMALNGLLEACSSYPQYFNSTSAPQEHLKPSDWLEGIMAALLDFNWTEDKTTWLKSFRSLVQISVPLVESNITKIIKTCLLNISVANADSKQEYCGLFTDLISLHSRLHQLPKFFVKLLRSLTESIKENSVGEYLLKGQLFSSTLESMALHLQGLHFGQTIELWTIFSETYTTFGYMSQVFPVGKGVVFILAQIFSTFLLHSKIFEQSLPSHIHEKYGELIQHTTNELKNNVSILSDANQLGLLQQSFLLLCSVLGKVKLSYTYHSESPFSDDLTWKSPDNPFDFSVLFSFFTEKHNKAFSILLNGENKVLSILVFQLLILKIESLMHKKELSEADLTQLKISISTVVQHAEDNIYKNTSWDLDLNSLSADNYGSAVWKMLLELLPLIMNTMHNKEIQKVCSCFREIILHDKLCDSSDDAQATDLKSIVLLSLRNPHFQQSKCFQGLLISSLWKLDSLLMSRKRLSVEMDNEESLIKVLTQLGCSRTKWMKYAESTPKSEESKELNPLWSDIKDTCACLNGILKSKQIARPKLKAKIYNILQLVDCVPLRYLLPGNQVRCVIGLSTLFFVAPESFKPEKVLKVAEKIAEQLIAIFDGERSIWLFDFVASGPYLRETVNTIEKVMEMEQSVEIPYSLKLLLEHLISLIARTPKVLSEAENYFSELVKEENFSTVSILMLNLMIQKLTQVFRRTELKPEYKTSCEQLASSICSCCAKTLKKCDTKCADSTYCSLIECYTEVIEILSIPACSIDQKRKDKCLSQLPRIIEFAKQTILERAVGNSENSLNSVILKFFTRICKHNEHITNFIPDALHSTIWDSIYFNFQERCTSIKPILSEAQSSQATILKDDEVELLKGLFPLLSSQELNNVFEELSNQLKKWNVADGLNTHALKMNLDITEHIIDCDLQKEESYLPKESLINLLSHLCYHVNETEDSHAYLHMVTLPVLHFVNFLIKQKKSYISDDQWLDCLHPCVTVNLYRHTNNLPTFITAFDAVWNVVYNLLVYHPGFILKTISVFMLIVTNLLKSLVKAGSQDAVHASANDVHDGILICSQNMNRLLTGITRHKIQFAKLVPFLIGDYADCVQHITLEANVKTHLISGLNRLLSLCSEDSLKMVSININHSCREIFSNIVKDYNQSRYRGYV